MRFPVNTSVGLLVLVASALAGCPGKSIGHRLMVPKKEVPVAPAPPPDPDATNPDQCVLVRTPAEPEATSPRGVAVKELPALYTRSWASGIVWARRGMVVNPSGTPIPMHLTFSPSGIADRLTTNPLVVLEPHVAATCKSWWGLHGRLSVTTDDGLWSGSFDAEVRVMDDGRDIITVPAAAARMGIQWRALDYTDVSQLRANFYAEFVGDQATGDLSLQLDVPGQRDPVVARWHGTN